MQAYGRVFTKVYNLLWNDFADRIAPRVYEFYAATQNGEARQPVFDLCCGTGRLSHFFLERGYRVVGLDLSEYMISYARENNLEYVVAQQAVFVQGDAADFKVEEKFGLTISTYDALNHLPDEDALRSCFRCVFEVLLEGGSFIFDLNTREGLRHWNGITVSPGDEVYLINRGMYDEHTIKAWTKITGFVRTSEGFYERFDETVYNSVFEMAAVRDWLRQAGFREIYCTTGEDLSIPIDDPEKPKRTFFVAQK